MKLNDVCKSIDITLEQYYFEFYDHEAAYSGFDKPELVLERKDGYTIFVVKDNTLSDLSHLLLSEEGMVAAEELKRSSFYFFLILDPSHNMEKICVPDVCEVDLLKAKEQAKHLILSYQGSK